MNFEEFLQPKEESRTDIATPVTEETAVEETIAEDVADNASTSAELDVQKVVVEELAADKAAMTDEIGVLKGEVNNLKGEIERLKDQIAALKSALEQKEAELAAEKGKEIDVQERNPNALALLDRETELPDRFPGETRDHVLEVIKEARDKAEADGRVRRAQLLEGVLVANEPNGSLAKKRAALEKFFNDNANVMTGPVIEELTRCGISHKNGEEYLLPSEILKRTY